LLGGIFAMMVRSLRAQTLLTPARLKALGSAAFAVLLLSFAQARHGSMFTLPLVRYGYLAASVTFAAVIGLSVHPGTWVSRLGEKSILRALGRCSYGLYLIHLVPVYWYRLALASAQSLGRAEWQREAIGTIVFVVYFALCFAMATLSYKTLESFFLRRKKLFEYEDEAAHPGTIST
jgi:peptidoglycan/LPS O-acetylase OafA/YrhL